MPPRRGRRTSVPQDFFGGGGSSRTGDFGGLLPGPELSHREYHIVLAGIGDVWARPYTGRQENWSKDYVFGMQGLLRGGSRNYDVSAYENIIHSLDNQNARFSGVLSDGRVITDAEFETDPSYIEFYGRREPTLTGDGWRTI